MANKNPKNQFSKGESGNDYGRPSNTRSMRQIFLNYFSKPASPKEKKTRLEKIIEILKTNAEAGDTMAAKYITDQCIGKPRETVDATVSGKLNVVIKHYDDEGKTK